MKNAKSVEKTDDHHGSDFAVFVSFDVGGRKRVCNVILRKEGAECTEI